MSSVSSDDEAPEAISMVEAKSNALESRNNEKKAYQHAKTIAAQKRKRHILSKEEPIEELSEDILEAVAIAHEEAEKKLKDEEEINKKNDVKKNEIKIKKKSSHTREFGTIHVQTLNAPIPILKELNNDVKDFLNLRTAPKRKRAKVVDTTNTRITRKK